MTSDNREWAGNKLNRLSSVSNNSIRRMVGKPWERLPLYSGHSVIAVDEETCMTKHGKVSGTI